MAEIVIAVHAPASAGPESMTNHPGSTTGPAQSHPIGPRCVSPDTVRRAELVVGVGAAQQVELAVIRPLEQVLGVHVGAADSPAGIADVELDDVVAAYVLGRGEPAQR